MQGIIQTLGAWSYLAALALGFGVPMVTMGVIDSRTPPEPSVYRNGAGPGLFALILGLIFSIILAITVSAYR